MGQAQTHALGRNRKFFCKAETTFGTWLVPSATDAAKIRAFNATVDQARADRMDSRASRSVLERITGRKTANWDMSAYLIPSGSAGTAPDLGPLFKAALGTETVAGGSSVTYGLSAAQDALDSLAMYDHYNDTLARSIFGAWVEELTISANGANEPSVTANGGCKDVVHTGTSTCNGAVSGTSATVQSADQTNFEQYSLLKLGSDDNSGAGHLVNSRSGATLTLNTSATASGGDAVVPFAPSETTAGSPINGIQGSIDIDGATPVITGFDCTIKNNIKPIDDEAFDTTVSDIIPSWREVTGSLTIRARKDMIKHFNNRSNFTTKDLQVVLGTTAGSILTINLNYVEYLFGAAEVPEADEGTLNLPFKALGSSGDDEIELVFT